MKISKFSIVTITVVAALLACGISFAAGKNEPTVYVIKKGDTLWGISERFIKDPYYWPDMWAQNPEKIGNPHFIYPGQRLRIFPDRIEVESTTKSTEAAPEPAREAAAPKAAETAAPETAVPVVAKSPEPQEKAVEERVFYVNGGEGFIAGDSFKPSGFIIAGQHNRRMFAEDDVVYTDIGLRQGGKAGDRFSVFKKHAAISHPVTNQILGYKFIPLGSLELTEMADKSSKALVKENFLEIEPGALLLPYRDRKKEIFLKAPAKDLVGYIVETKSGIQAIAAGDIAYIDLGEVDGVKPGNILYVVRNVKVEIDYFSKSDYDLPVDVLGALVVVDTAKTTSTALVIKSIDSIYKGDRLEMKKGH
jgi:LysM domain-containing protein